MLVDVALIAVSGALTGATYAATYHNDPPHRWPHRRFLNACHRTVTLAKGGVAYAVVSIHCYAVGRLSVALFHVKHGAYWLAWQVSAKRVRGEDDGTE